MFVDRRVLIPRPETEVTAQWALDALASSPQPRSDRDVLRAADLGTGSGAIALSLAVESEAGEIWATDVSADALEVTRANLAGVGRPAGRVRLAEGCWYEALPVGLRGQIDVVVSNPPYIAAAEGLPAEVADWEPTRALVAGATGLEAIETLVAQAPDWLRPGGQLVVEIAPHQATEVLAMAQATALASASVEVDLAGRPRVLVARAR